MNTRSETCQATAPFRVQTGGNGAVSQGDRPPPKRQSDKHLLRTWRRLEPSERDPNDVAFKAGASDVFVPKSSPKPPTDVKEFTAATWNVKNLFMRGAEQISPPTGQSYASILVKKPERELRALATGLKKIDADIAGLQEVDNLPGVDKFQKEYMGKESYPHRVLVEGNDGRGIDVALLSRFPIIRAYTYRDHTFPVEGEVEPTRFSRDLLEAIVQVTPKYQVRVFVTHSKSHLKSRPGGPPEEKQREAEARAIRKILDLHQKANPSEPILLLMDANDPPQSRSVRIMKGNPETMSDPLKLEGKENTPTHHNEEFGDTRFDYLLGNAPLMAGYKKKSATVVHTKTVHEASDHDPVVATFRIS